MWSGSLRASVCRLGALTFSLLSNELNNGNDIDSDLFSSSLTFRSMSGHQNAEVVRIVFASLHDEKGSGKYASHVFPYFFEPPEVDEGIQILQLQFFSFFFFLCCHCCCLYWGQSMCVCVRDEKRREGEKEMRRRVTMQSSCWWEQLIYLFSPFSYPGRFFSRLSIVNLHSSTFTHHSIGEEQRHLHQKSNRSEACGLFICNKYD